jgi:LuxR family maltose regulon positive regulatory protein
VLLAERYLSTIDLLLAGDKVSDKERLDLLGKTNVVRGYQARYAGQTDLSLDFFKNAVGSLLNSDLFFDIAMINLAILHATQGRLDASAAILNKYSKISEAQAHLWITMTGIFGLSRIQLIRGNLQSAREICEAGLQQFQERGLQDIPVCSMLHLQLGEIDYLQNRLDEASCHAKRALELAMAGGMELNQACSEVLLVKIKLSQGQISSLTAVYESRLLAFWASVSLVIPSLSGQLAQLWLLQGRSSELTESLAQRGISAKTLRPEWEMEALVLAGLLLQQRRSVEAFDLLTNLHLNAQKEQRYGVLIEIMLLQTLVRLEQNNPKSATQFLCMAMNLAQGSAQLRPFLNAGAGIHLLLRNMDVPAALSLFRGELLAAFSVMTVAASDQAIEQEIFSLSAKEDKIARLLVTGLSNEEIAAKMFLSPNTVKFHLKSLYRKLDVNKRYDAIQKIRG